jgi:hypothetical protein
MMVDMEKTSAIDRHKQGTAKRLFVALAAASAVFSFSGCMSVQEVAYTYFESEMSPYLTSGAAKVTGQAFLRQRGGGVVVCAGEPVLLVPNIGVFAEAVRLRRSGVQPKIAGKQDGRVFQAGTADPVAKKAIRQAVCDAQGNFELAGLPAGKWILYSRVQWVVGEYDWQQGSDLIAEVTTENTGEQKILLTDANRI